MAAWILTAQALACAGDAAPAQRRVPPDTGAQLFVRTSGIQAGRATPEAEHDNPFEGDREALQAGKRLYSWFNCAGCHGVLGGGGMGPALADSDWIYGAGAGHVYQSIRQGRPQGMPAFMGHVSEEDTWKLVAYVRSLSAPPAAEDTP